MFLLRRFEALSVGEEALLDTILLLCLVVPFSYISLFKPFQKIIEERKQEEVERDNLQKMSQLKTEFISTAAHELRTPMTVIMGFTELLSGECGACFTEEQRQELLQDAHAGSVRLSRVVDDLLDISRIETGQKISLDQAKHSLAELLEKAVRRFQFRAEHEIVLQCGRELPKELLLDDHRIDQVLENLISNAVKYSPKGTRIEVSADCDDRQVRVRVADQGIGMTEEQKAHVFDKFYRADFSNTSVSGLGLGMSIAKQIVEEHGGSIWVESKVGEGTRVTFSLPR